MKLYLGVRDCLVVPYRCALSLCPCLGKVDCPFSPSIGSFQPDLQRTQRAFMYGFAAVLCVSALQKKRMNAWVFSARKKNSPGFFFLLQTLSHLPKSTHFTSIVYPRAQILVWIGEWFDWTRPSVWVKSYDSPPLHSLLPPDTRTSFPWPLRFFSLVPPSQSLPFRSRGVSLTLSFWVNADGFIGTSIGPH